MLTNISSFIAEKEHITELLGYFWDDEQQHYCEVFGQDYSGVNWDDKEQVATVLNLQIKAAQTNHIFHTLTKLRYASL